MSDLKDEKFNVNISPVNWYVARILLRFEFYDEDKSNLNKRCLAWENQILIKADSPNEAYKKAIRQGKLEGSEMWTVDKKRKGKFYFEGLTGLVAIYEELEDGSEITWTKYENRTVKKVKSWVLPKDKLEVFKND